MPAIAEVEERRLELEREAEEAGIEIKNLQEQLRESIRKQAKTAVMLENSERRVREMEQKAAGQKERMQALRKVKAQ